MLSKEDNELITRVGPGSPMGELFRRYWLPAMLSSELPEPDCPPVKLRLLGEDLIAFRVTSGEVGLLDTYCPHRNANLYWGRNEQEGLRCAYHGWKFDVAGNCVDMPNEPPTSNFASKVHQRAYRAVDKRVQECNWLQNLEGEVDSSHAPFLHGSVGPDGMLAYNGNEDRHPIFSVVETDFGLAIAARRDAPNDQYYWRVTPFMLPSYTIVPRAREANYIFTAAIPVDDENMIGMTVIWSPDHAITVPPVVNVDEKFHSPRTSAMTTWSTGSSRRRRASPAFVACACRIWRSRRTSAGRSPIDALNILARAT